MATDGTNVFDPTVYPQFDNIRDRHSVRPGNERVYFGEDSFAQGADVNEAFSIEADKRTDIGNLIAKDGDRLSGGDVVIDINAGTVFIAAGDVYALGGRRTLVAKTMSAVPMAGSVILGFRRTVVPVTADDDPIYLGLVADAQESYGEPGATRSVWSFAWAFDTDNGDGDFFPYATMKDGVLVAQDAPPTLSGVQQQLAVYDYDAHDNYIVRGCAVSPLGLSAGKQVFSIGEGVANILGFKINRPSASRLQQQEQPAVGTVDSEPHTFDDGGTGTAVITVRRTPISSVSSAIVTKQKTATIVKGNTGLVDPLPDDSVTSIISVVQGGTTYHTPADFVQNGDGVDWSPGGAEPTTGSSYQVTYRYLDAVTPSAITQSTVTLAGGVTGQPVFLGYTYKIPRVDKICIDQFGNISYLQGISAAVQAQPPQVPTTLLSLATVYNDWFGTPTVKNDGIKAYPFPLIDRMYNKLLDVLNLVTLQKQALDINVRSAGSATGTFSDPLTDDSFRDAGEVQNGAVFQGSFQIPIVPTFINATLSATAMLEFQQETVINQPLISSCEKINPYQAFSPLPAVLKITPSEDYWTVEQTTWLSAQTQVFGSGNTERVVDTEILVSTQQQPIRYLRQISVAFQISKFGPGEELDALTFDSISVNPGGLVADANGIVSGSFTIPANVTSGVKNVVATGGSGAVCGALFTGQGLLEIKELQQVTTVQKYQVDPPARASVSDSQVGGNGGDRGGFDPQAQSFVLTEGRHISSLDLKFCNIGDRTQPVIVQFVTMDNGFPTTEVIAQSEIDMANVVAGQWTRFNFPTPFYLPENTYFAFVIATNDPNHSISVAERGQFDAADQKWIAAQPYTVGTRFSSSNAVSWTVHQDSDVTFAINCAVFNPVTKTLNVGTFAVTNCSDLIVRGDIFLPTDAASVVFRVTFGTEAPIQILPDQVWERGDFFTGNVVIDAILAGSSKISPVLRSDILVIAGTMQATGVYISDAWKMGSSVKVDAVMSTKLPVGSALTVECDAANDSWQSMPLSLSVVEDQGFIEQTYEKASFTAVQGRLRLTLAGTPAARPTVADLRAYTI
jgi:hypothetical protein